MGHFFYLSLAHFRRFLAVHLFHEVVFCGVEMAKIVRSATLSTENSGLMFYFSAFLRAKTLSCSESSIKIYKHIGEKRLIPALQAAGVERFEDVTAEQLRAIIEDYKAGHERGGVDFIHRHIKAFFRWYWAEYEVEGRCPIDAVRIRRHRPAPREGISREEVEAVLKACRETSNFPERDTAMIMILCDTGIRMSSLVGLRMQDVDAVHERITTFEKDQRFHYHAYGLACAKAVRRYLACIQDARPEDPFWLQTDGSGLSAAGARSRLSRLCKYAGIEQHGFHDFRRFYAMELYRETHDIYFVSRALDHKNVEVTKRYLAIDMIEDAEDARRISPMDRSRPGAVVRRK